MRLFCKAGLAQALQEAVHSVIRIRDRCLDPGDRDVWLHLAKQPHGRSGLLDQSRLRQTCAQDAMPGGTSRPHLHLLPSPIDSFGVPTCEIVGSGQAPDKGEVQRITRAHSDRTLQVLDGVFRPPIAGERKADIAVGGCKIGIQIECPSKAIDGLVGLASRKREITQRDMSPGILIVERGRATCALGRECAILRAFGPSQVRRND